jgi:hypothetical protein
MRRFLVVAVVGLLAACGSSGGGGGSSSGEGQQYVDAIASKYQTSSSPFTKAQARCVAGQMVDAIGVDTLKNAGITPSDIENDKSGSSFNEVGKKLTEKQATELAGAITGGKCFNFTDLVVKSLSKNDATFRKLGTTKAKCMFDELLNDGSFKQAMVNSILGRSSENDAFSKAFSNQSKIFKILGDCNIKPSELNG